MHGVTPRQASDLFGEVPLALGEVIGDHLGAHVVFDVPHRHTELKEKEKHEVYSQTCSNDHLYIKTTCL